jgi:hypothetical protein
MRSGVPPKHGRGHAPEEREQEFEQSDGVHKPTVAHEDECLHQCHPERWVKCVDALFEQRCDLRREPSACLGVARSHVAHKLDKFAEPLLWCFRSFQSENLELRFKPLVLLRKLLAVRRRIAFQLPLKGGQRELAPPHRKSVGARCARVVGELRRVGAPNETRPKLSLKFVVSIF